jgi:hypothetical protein
MKAAINRCAFIFILTWLSSCGPLKETARYQFIDGEYLYRQRTGKYELAYIENQLGTDEDSVFIFSLEETGEPRDIVPGDDQYFLKRALHLNVLTIPFKFRPSIAGFPSQLNSSFNGEIFLGYRLDKFRLHYIKTPAGLKHELLHWGISGGIFAGIGSTPVTPWTTNYQTMDEYNGFVVSRGVSLMGSINRLTVGFGVGMDYLTDRDRKIWIHQNKPWYGLTIGLNLN